MSKLLAMLGIHLYRDRFTGAWMAQINTQGFVVIMVLVFMLGLMKGLLR